MRHLRNFVAAADDLRVTRGAGRIDIAQPTPRHRIKGSLIGGRFLQRLAHRVTFSGLDKLVVVDARAILAEVGYRTRFQRRGRAIVAVQAAIILSAAGILLLAALDPR